MSDELARTNAKARRFAPIEGRAFPYTGPKPPDLGQCGHPHPNQPDVVCTIDRNHRAPQHSAVTAAGERHFHREQWQ